MAKKDELGEDYVELVSLMIQEREEYRPDFQTLAQLVEGKKSAEEQERILKEHGADRPGPAAAAEPG